MRNNPIVSIVIPCYNAAKYIGAAIDSIAEQNYRPIEVIVVDDGSTDSSVQVVKRYIDQHNSTDFSVILEALPHGGVCVALNRGVELVRGEYLSFLDADDLWVNGKLRKQLDVLANNAKKTIIFGYMQRFSGDVLTSNSMGEIQHGEAKATMLIKTDHFKFVGKFDENLNIGDFIDWYARAQEAEFESLTIPEVLAYRRIHGDNMTIRQRDDYSDYTRVLKAALDRRRQAKVNQESL